MFGKFATLRGMKRITLLSFLLCAAILRADDLPPAQQILAFARAQLPKQPIRMNGSLKEFLLAFSVAIATVLGA